TLIGRIDTTGSTFIDVTITNTKTAIHFSGHHQVLQASLLSGPLWRQTSHPSMQVLQVSFLSPTEVQMSLLLLMEVYWYQMAVAVLLSSRVQIHKSLLLMVHRHRHSNRYLPLSQAHMSPHL